MIKCTNTFEIVGAILWLGTSDEVWKWGVIVSNMCFWHKSLLVSWKKVIFANKIEMNDDILESVSQRGYGAYDEENRRIREISDELQRLCRIYEEESRNCKANGNQGAVSTITSKMAHLRQLFALLTQSSHHFSKRFCIFAPYF